MATQPAALLGLQRTNLREQALAALRTAITRGELRPHSALVETELSERLGISRGTLREALRQLQQEGLVVAGVRNRLHVRSLDTKEIGDIFAVRAALEALAASVLAAIPDRGALVRDLRAALDRMGAAGRDNLDDRIEADLDFHRLLCTLTDNETLVHSWTSLEGSIRMSIMYAGTEQALGNMDTDRHSVIIDAIDSGDPDAARHAVIDHMRWAADNLVAGAGGVLP
ncbi:GntR family transcriptional regulator [Gordonia sp. OPL2]|uniref:GntR family transcriptional regulator n=1 Tax=Gordonia sp. OPL2 TaxID=2486274 RepID=UPI0016568194|nr:GntR family transcriptional regulator [Gordonia sp. OPL2]RPA12395.1 GntR family transcriptional regulator [Gordonia sp. OPL2]